MGRRIGSLFSGAGGLDLAVQAVFGGEVVWHAEIDKAASKVLAYRFPGVPNLGDISAVDWAEVPAVDVLCGGFPCQDVSAAGKRAGIKAGTRSGLWSVFADAIDELRPRWVVIENVRGLLSATAHRTVDDADSDVEPAAGVMGDGAGRPVLRAAGAVLGDLADLGYDAQWATVAAADVGAPHRRERVFILACASAAKGNGWDEGRPRLARLVGGFDAAVSGDEPGVALLPTPCVVDRLATGEMTLEEWDECRRSQKERGVGSFGPRGDSLGAAILRVEEGGERPDYSTTKARRGGDEPGVAQTGDELAVLLPTPTAEPFTSRSGDRIAELGLAGVVQTFLPTPSTHDTTGARSPESINKMDKPFFNLNDTVVNELLSTPQARDSKGMPRDDFNQACLPRDIIECDTAWGKYEPTIRRWESLTRPAPKPTEPGVSGMKRPRLNPAFSEWMMGWPNGWVTNLGLTRKQQLQIIGNGVVPQQAAAALQFLMTVCRVSA